KRQHAMLDFAVKLTTQPWEIEEEDRERLRRAGFNDRDIWDIASVAAFYNMTNRVASATDMRPNSAYHRQARYVSSLEDTNSASWIFDDRHRPHQPTVGARGIASPADWNPANFVQRLLSWR